MAGSKEQGKTTRTYQGEQIIVYFHHGGAEATEKRFFLCREVPAKKKFSGRTESI